MNSGFYPSGVKLRKMGDIAWVNYKGENTQPSDCLLSEEDVANGAEFNFEDISFFRSKLFCCSKFNVLCRSMGTYGLS